MDMQNVKNLDITEGSVKTIHDKNNQLLWGAVGYDTKYAGDIYQQTYSGKNLFDSYIATKPSWQAGNLVVNSDGSLTLSGNTGANNYFQLGQNLGEICPELQVGDTAYLYLDSTSSVKNIYISVTGAGVVWANGYSQTITQPMLDAKVVVYGGYNQTDTLKIMIVKNELPTFYEPYVGGIPSPNPDYPQDIQVVTWEQTVTISDGANSEDFKVNLTSKNLFNVPSPYSIVGGANDIKNLFVNYEIGKTYTISCGDVTKGGPNNPVIRIVGASPEYLSLAPNTSITFTMNSEITHIYTYSNGSNYGESVGKTSIVDNLMIEEGSTATPYAPYFAPIELCKIGDYQDYIYKSGDDWYVHKETKKDIISSINYIQNDTFIYLLDDVLQTNNTGVTIVYSNYYLAAGSNYRSDIKNYQICKIVGDNKQIGFKDNRYSTETDMNNWLSTHNLILYYALATPTDTQITDTTLISELEAIHEWLTRYGYTPTVSGNLPLIINQTNLT